jgi:hypothetical protein
MSGALLLGATVGILLVAGWLVAASLGVEAFLLRCLAAYILAWAGLVTAVAALSVPGWLTRWSLVCAVAVMGAAGIAVAVGRGTRVSASLDAAWREALADPAVRVLGVAVLVAGIYLGAVAFLTTPNDWDGLTYHETRALLWDQQDRVGYVVSGNEPRLNGNPPISEVGLYLAMIVPRSERFAALPQFVALWAGLVAVVLLARRLGLSRQEAAYSGLVFASLPLVLLHGAAVLNDLVVASFLLCAVVFLLGRTTVELGLGAVALGLALGSKFSAVLALPLLLAVVLVGVRRGRRRRAAVACVAGIALGAPWYVLNVLETGSLTGDLAAATGQRAELTVRAVVGSLRALVFDVVDTSGLWRSELYVAVGVGGALVVLGLVRGAHRTATGRALVGGGLLVALAPLLLRGLERPAHSAWRRLWLALGQDGIARDHGDAWTVLSLPDSSQSWYGVVGAIVIVGGVAAAIVAVRRGELPSTALVLALAPLVLALTFVLTIVYDPWRGRLLMFGVGLACAAWGWTLRVRWLTVGVVGLGVTTLVFSLAHSHTKPSWRGLLETPWSQSVWARDRIDTLTVVRGHDGTPALLRAVEQNVPADAEIVVAMPMDSFVAPLAGPRLTRTLRLVADDERVPADAAWLVARGLEGAVGCPEAWQTVFVEPEYRSRLLRRVRSDSCGPTVAGL